MDESERVVEALIEDLPDAERKAMRAMCRNAKAGEERFLRVLPQLIESLSGKEHINLQDLNERQVEWLEELAMGIAPAGEIALNAGPDDSLLRRLSTVQVATMGPRRLGVALMAGNSLEVSDAWALLIIGLAAYIAKLAEIARAARTEKASRAASN